MSALPPPLPPLPSTTDTAQPPPSYYAGVVLVHDDEEEIGPSLPPPLTSTSPSPPPSIVPSSSERGLLSPSSTHPPYPHLNYHPSVLSSSTIDLGDRTSSSSTTTPGPSSPTSLTSPSTRPPLPPSPFLAFLHRFFAIPDGLQSAMSSLPSSTSAPPLPPLPHFPYFSFLLLLVTAVLLFAMIGWGGGVAAASANPMIGPYPSALLHFGAKFTPIQLNHAEHWRPFVSTFLYCGFIHILLGWLVGMPFLVYLERVYGTPRMVFIWVTAGWAGQLWSALFGPTLIGVGGTTAMAAIIGAYWAHLILTYQVHSKGELNGALLWSCTAYVLLLIFGIFPFVNNWGHLAGMAVGFFLGIPTLSGVLFDQEGHRLYRWPLIVPALCVFIVTIVCAGYYFYTEDKPYSWCETCHWVECINTASWDCIPPEIPAICFQEPVGSYDVDDTQLTQGWC